MNSHSGKTREESEALLAELDNLAGNVIEAAFELGKMGSAGFTTSRDGSVCQLADV